MKNTINLAAIIALSALTFTSCKPEEEEKKEIVQSENSAYIVSEGNFGSGNGDITYVNLNNDAITTELFNAANGVPAGEVQSLTIANDKAYIIASGSNRIEVAELDGFTSSATISDLLLPRFMVVNGNTGYVSEWMGYDANFSTLDTGRISIIDLSTNTITGSIKVSKGPEKMLIHEGNLYVANKDTNLVSVIDLATNTLVQNLVVSHGPNSFAVDNTNSIRILCSGKSAWAAGGPTAGALLKLNNSGLSTIDFNNTNGNPSSLLVNEAGDVLYYNFNGVCKVASNASAVNTSAEISGYYYGISIDKKNDVVYAFDAKDFTTSGDAIRLHADGITDTLFNIGLIPNGAVFVN